MTLKFKVNQHHFAIGLWRVPWYTIGANLVMLDQNRDKLSRWKARFSLIWRILMPKWPWRSRSIYTIFSRILEGSKIHIWCKFGDPRLKTWWVILWTNPFLVDLIVLTPNDLEGQGQSTPFSIGLWRVPWYTIGANLAMLAQNRDELSCRKACFSLIWHVLTPKWPWRSRSINTIFNRALEGPNIHLWCKFGDPRLKTWRVIVQRSPFWVDLGRFNPKLPWRSRSINTIFNRILDGLKFHM